MPNEREKEIFAEHGMEIKKYDVEEVALLVIIRDIVDG